MRSPYRLEAPYPFGGAFLLCDTGPNGEEAPTVTGGCTNWRGFFRSVLRGPRWEGEPPITVNSSIAL